MECKDDDKAFIFTLKNDHGVEPTRFMKREESRWAISCGSNYGPLFDNVDYHYDIHINDICNKENSCWIDNDGQSGYKCHPIYKKSLFVNTAGPIDRNYFSVLDYEVFRISNFNDYLCHICKYPDIIWEYIETKDISEELLKQIDDDTELLSDLDAIHCDDSNIRLKISHYCLINPSQFLPNTQIANQQYDDPFREWLGNDYKWKLLYRASEHGYSAKSFHEYCDNKGPTLMVVKSSGGWIFGGYTTESWSDVCI